MKTSPTEVLQSTELCIKKGNLEKALNTLLAYFKESADQQSANEVLILLSSLSVLKRNKQLYGEPAQREENRIADAILGLRNKIIPEDERPAPPPAPIYKHAKLLHDIPRKMTVGAPTLCIVRLAPDKASLLRYFKQSPDTRIEKIDQLGSVTRVTLKPLNKGDFRIQLVGKPERHIFPDVYTEWTFFVTPLREGRHTLNLDILLTRYDATGTAPWEKVFTEEIEVSSNAEPERRVLRAVANLESSPVAMAGMPWWMSLSLAYPVFLNIIAGTGSGIVLGVVIAMMIPSPPQDTALKAFVKPKVYFVNPLILYQGDTLGYTKNETSDVLTVDVPESQAGRPDVVEIRDQGRAFSGAVNRAAKMIQLHLIPFPPPPPPPQAPLWSTPRTYFQISSMEDSLFVSVDDAYTYVAMKTGNLYYVIQFNDTIYSHHFKTHLDSSEICELTALLHKNRDTIQLPCKPIQSSTGGGPGGDVIIQPPSPSSPPPPPPPLTTKVTMSLPYKAKVARVSVNGQVIPTFQQRSWGQSSYVSFNVLRGAQRLVVEVKDDYCTYRAGGIPSTSKLMLAGVSDDCRKRRLEIVLNRDLQRILDENEQHIAIEARTEKGERVPVTTVRNGSILHFDVPNGNLDVLMMLKLSSGSMLKICAMKIYQGDQALLRPSCNCSDCIVRIKPL